MSHLHVKYLLVGGGVASDAAAKAIVAHDPAGDVLLVGQEINRPYHRPPLSKRFLRRQQTREQLFTSPADWFSRHQVQLRTGRRVSHLNGARGSVMLDSGQEISYDRLLLATGASPAPLAVPGSHLPNLFYLRTIEDAERLHHAIDQALRSGRSHHGGRGRVAVIGAGLLGTEVAASLFQCGLAVDLICSRAYPWERYAGEVTGRFLLRTLTDAGLTVHASSRCSGLEGDGRVQRAVLDNGKRLECDFAVAAVGTLVHKELLRGTPITAERAVLVDDHCRTNVPHIYAAGDCAAMHDPLFGKHRLMEHWDAAAETGRVAGMNMAGRDTRYNHVSRFDSQVLDVALTVWGEGKLVDHRLLREGSGGFVEIGVAADARVAQIIRVGTAEDPAVLENMVARRMSVAGLEERLKDGASPLPSADIKPPAA